MEGEGQVRSTPRQRRAGFVLIAAFLAGPALVLLGILVASVFGEAEVRWEWRPTAVGVGVLAVVAGAYCGLRWVLRARRRPGRWDDDRWL